MGSRAVIDQQALATDCVHWKRTVPYSKCCAKTAQTICTGYKENIVVLESGYFFDYLCHWNVTLAEKSHWQVQKVTLAGPKSHTRAKMSHWSVIICSKYSSTIFHEVSWTFLHGKEAKKPWLIGPHICLIIVNLKGCCTCTRDWEMIA